jgi:hypothetical protein
MAKKTKRKVVTTKRNQSPTWRAISELRTVSELFSGTDLAKQAHALELALASPETSEGTTHKRVMAFAEAAGGSARPRPKTKKASAGKSVDQP